MVAEALEPKDFTLGLAQCVHPSDLSESTIIAMIESWCRRAHEQHVDLLVFPESLMMPFEVDKNDFLAAAQSCDGSFCTSVNALAKQYNLWVVYTFSEQNEDPHQNPYNSVVITDNKGAARAMYRKVHLFDTDAARESDKMSAGDRLFTPIESPFGRIGLGICYDLRFPELARNQALQGCDVLLYPAAWVDGTLKKAQWQALLCARAIENELFVAGVSRVDRGYSGYSAIVGPDGMVLASGNGEEELITARIDVKQLEKIRSSMPVFKHRRPDVYGNS